VRVLVTGGAGYVGGFAARALDRGGCAVTVLDDLSQGHADAAPPGSLVEGDAGDTDLLSRLLSERRIEAVLHFAASASVPESVRAPERYWRNNVARTLTLLEAMLARGVQRIVFSSTCAVYAPSDDPLDEDCPLAPESPYAFTKLAIERMMADFARAHGLGWVALRYFNAAGGSEDGAHGEDHDPETHLIPLVLRAAAEGREPQVFGDDWPTPDGTCIRDYVHVEDLADAHVRALERCPDPGTDPSGRVLNLGTGGGHSVLEVIRSVERVVGKPIPHRVAPRRAGDPARLVASPGRAQRELGWKARHAEIDAIVGSAFAWHRSHPRGYGG
jgi:UDP-glucose 4-epimerase